MKHIFISIILSLFFFETKAQIIPEGTYCIKYAYNSEFCMDLSENGKIANGQNILLWTYWGGNGQKWIVSHDRGAIIIRSYVNSNYVVDLLNGNATNDNNIQLYQYNGSNAQRWFPEYIDGHYILHSAVNQNICLDLYCGNATNGTNIQVYTVHKGWPQRWIFERIDGTPTSGSNSGGQVKVPQNLPCTACGGARHCNCCSGKGWDYIGSTYSGDNRTMKCSCCNGSGICYICHGTGISAVIY